MSFSLREEDLPIEEGISSRKASTPEPEA